MADRRRGARSGRKQIERHERGARREQRADRGGDKGGASKWLLPLLALIALAVVLFFVIKGCGDDESTESASTGTTAEATPEADAGAESMATQAAGSLTADGQDLLPLPNGGLEQFADASVTGTGVAVESVVADEAFWVGESEQERVFVHLELTGESPFKVQPGDSIDLSGSMKPVQGTEAEQFGVTAEEGLDQLESQGQYIEVTELAEGSE
jgi:hypothetical protein